MGRPQVRIIDGWTIPGATTSCYSNLTLLQVWTLQTTCVAQRPCPPTHSRCTQRRSMASALETRLHPSDTTSFVSSLFRWPVESTIFRHGCQILARRLSFQGLTSPSLPKRGFKRSISTTLSSTPSRGKDSSLSATTPPPHGRRHGVHL